MYSKISPPNFDLKHLFIIPGPRLKRKSVQVAPRPGNNWSTACKWQLLNAPNMGEKYYQANFIEEVQNLLLSLIRCNPVICIWGLTDTGSSFLTGRCCKNPSHKIIPSVQFSAEFKVGPFFFTDYKWNEFFSGSKTMLPMSVTMSMHMVQVSSLVVASDSITTRQIISARPKNVLIVAIWW